MTRPGPGHPPPGEMTVAELEAAVAALPGKRDALREAYDRLAACSPAPLPFAWADLDARMSSLQSSISLRFRQVRALEAARPHTPAAAAAAPGGTRGDGTGQDLEEDDDEVWEVEEVLVDEQEEVVEEGEAVVEVVEVEGEDEEVMEVEEEVVEGDEGVMEVEEEDEKAGEGIQEGGDDKADNKIGTDGTEEKEARDEVLQEQEVEEVADCRIGIDTKDAEEASWEKQDADEEMQVVNEDVKCTENGEMASHDKEEKANVEEDYSMEGAKKACQDKEEDASMDAEQNTNMEEAVAKKTSAMHKEDQACGVNQEGEKEEEEEEEEAHEEGEDAKNVTREEIVVVKEVSQDQGNESRPCGFDERTAACENMDAQSLVERLFTNTGLNSEFHAALHCAPDAAALALHIVELFLHNKMAKTNKAWVNCVGLIRMVPVVSIDLYAETIERAKQVAKDWKEMIHNPKRCTVLGRLAPWGLLYFLISYNIVLEFETKEIFHLFGTIPRKQQFMNYAMLFKGLRLTDRIPELMDYLIGNGQQMDVLYLACAFNLVDKYPPVSLLKGYVEKAKQTAAEISHKNMSHQSLSEVITKELGNLRRALDLAKQQITDSSLSSSIMQQHMESNKRHKEQEKEHHEGQGSQQQGEQHTESNKKHKKKKEHHEGQESQQQGHHEGQESQQQGQQSKTEETLDMNQDKPHQKKQKKRKQEDKPQEKQQLSKQHTPKLPAWTSPAEWNSPLRGHFGHPQYAAIHGYPAQASWPGVHCVPSFTPQLGAPEYIVPFIPFYHHPGFYPC